MASYARQNGNCEYRLWETEELINEYAFEMDRIDRKDRETTQRLIKQELKRRFSVTLKMMDDPDNSKNPKGIFRYLLNN